MKKVLDFQHQNLFLWVAPIMAFGAALYFSLPYEPNIPYAIILSGALFTIMIWSRVPLVLRAVAIFMFGFIYAFAYTHVIDTPQPCVIQMLLARFTRLISQMINHASI